ncbi:MAG: DEAD/DEAH box helicase family protein, partial [Desulfovibrio sp.]|nr:DEAD/DEAH box helicase family protein [Desulfovibrio sp.]
MKRLTDSIWKHKYTSDDGSLLTLFYIPALQCAVQYDRTTGFYSADVLTAASKGIESLVKNNGHMRLIVGCTLAQDEINAIVRGEDIKEAVERHLLGTLSDPLLTQSFSEVVRNALELLAWMVAKDIVTIKIAIPCNEKRQPRAGSLLFHEKAGLILDGQGNMLAFNGSLNETANGWKRNWESFHVYTSWTESRDHLAEEAKTFQTLWHNESPSSIVLPLGEALKEELLTFLPKDELPKRLAGKKTKTPSEESIPPSVVFPFEDEYKKTWAFIHEAPKKSGGGERVGEATAAVVPWPHQIHSFNRMYTCWPPRLLIADEVGLGKTIQAGLLLRQAWLAGKAKRIFILAPKAVISQWQIELREKFNLNWPIYDGKKLSWYPSPALKDCHEKVVADDDWHKEPFVLASSQLMRRHERRKEIINKADPWDIVVLDEAHHARRKGGIGSNNANDLLTLMQAITAKKKTQGLILLTATPMQVHPSEVWDLLHLLGLPKAWTEQNFLTFYEMAAHPSPDATMLSHMAELYRASKKAFGALPQHVLLQITKNDVLADKITKALDNEGLLRLQRLTFDEKKVAVAVMKALSPTKVLIARHTRELLRQYHKQGKLTAQIATRSVEDISIELAPEERALYDAMQDFIATTYNQASQEKRTAVGFVMTIYRRRLASSFEALQKTLQKHLAKLDAKNPKSVESLPDEDAPDDELSETSDEELASMERLLFEERESIDRLLSHIARLPIDSKVQHLLTLLQTIEAENYKQVIIFTQFTDTLDYLRNVLTKYGDPQRILCYSGRGGECYASNGWTGISREETKRRFREGSASILLCTDAAAEGLNFQFCGALINYDMPWNPMRVEQRIGRIDRLGQKYAIIRIFNLLYKDTVETDIYFALKDRIHMFTTFVGKLQPILAKLPRTMAEIVLAPSNKQEACKNTLLQ